MGQKLSRGQWTLATAVVALATLAALNCQSLLFASAVVTSVRRPGLLGDAEWSKPETARAFRQRFHPGVPETDLLRWLRTNDFDVDLAARQANLRVTGVPCAEQASVSWVADKGKLSRSDAVVIEAGCL